MIKTKMNYTLQLKIRAAYNIANLSSRKTFHLTLIGCCKPRSAGGASPLQENSNYFCLSCMLGFTAHLQFVIGTTLDTIWFQSCLLQILCNQVVLVINTFNLTSDSKSSAVWFGQTDWTVISNHIWWIMFFVQYLWWATDTKRQLCSYCALLCMLLRSSVRLHAHHYFICIKISWKENILGKRDKLTL